MSKRCDICGKSVSSGHLVSHSNIKTKRIWAPNVQKIRIVAPNGAVRRADVCTRCLRSGKVRRAV